MLQKILITGFAFFTTLSLSSQIRQMSVSVKDTITDKDIVVPDEIERNYDQLLVDWKLNFKPANNCGSDYSSNVNYPDSIYINRLYSLPTIMELAYNPIVRSYIDMYTGRMKTSVGYFLGKSQYYFPIFEKALDKYGLPLELKYLPIIESALNPTIVSRAGATGLWQFMIGTGKMYNLEINSLVDERRDPFRSTDAAARYLKDLYNIYRDWNLVIAAYNCGPGNVNKAIRRSGGATDYWSIYPYLPRETRGYVPAFIGATYAMNFYAVHNICPSEFKYLTSIDTIQINQYLHFEQLANVLDIDIEQIRILNPQFKKDIVPGQYKPYLITLPSTAASKFEVLKDSIYAYEGTDFKKHRKVVIPEGTSTTDRTTKTIRHKVRRGETLSGIAGRYGVTVKQIRSWNRLKSNRIRIGQRLVVQKTVIRKKKEEPKTTKKQQKVVDNSKDVNREVESSSTLSEYFSKHLKGDDKDENNRLLDEYQTIYHKVLLGETLQSIATKYNVDQKDIKKWNKIKSSIPIGQRLVIHLPSQKEIVDLHQRDVAETDSLKNKNNGKGKVLNQKSSKKKVSQKQHIQFVSYRIKKGDTLGALIKRSGSRATLKEVMRLNNLSSTKKLRIGQMVKIPKK